MLVSQHVLYLILVATIAVVTLAALHLSAVPPDGEQLEDWAELADRMRREARR